VSEERPSLLVVSRGRDHRDVESLDLLDPVVVDLGEDDLLFYTQSVVPLPVERLGRHALEVADARERHVEQAVE